MHGQENYVRQIILKLRTDPSSVPIVHGDTPVTAGEFVDGVLSAAAAMRASGVGRDGVVAVLTNPNTPATLLLRYAANLLGATAVHVRGCNAADPDDELSASTQLRIVGDVEPTMLAVDGDNIGPAIELCASLPKRPRLGVLGGAVPGAVDLSAPGTVDVDDAELTEIAVVTYTSGSTGHPKGVSWPFTVKNEMVAMSAVRDNRAACLVTAPLTHSSGGTADDTIITGGLVVLHHGFDAAAVLRAVERYELTRLVVGSPQVYQLASTPTRARPTCRACARSSTSAAPPRPTVSRTR